MAIFSRPEAADHLKPIHPRQHNVEHDDVVLAAPAVREAILAVIDQIDRVPLLLHQLSERLSQPLLIFHDQDTHGE